MRVIDNLAGCLAFESQVITKVSNMLYNFLYQILDIDWLGNEEDSDLQESSSPKLVEESFLLEDPG